ncbi:polyprotein [Phytophthora megakarya]|uniref:Polyprotein n=1 Tax=Phytophthora megakarya TaxID=4795 RepID=A0A225UPE7_9STRA|nr:polyprotein [Phytophthora megakarya]
MNRTIMEKARSMLHYKGVSSLWWAEAVNTAVYLINRSTNTANSRTTPYELGFKTKPRMDHLRVFGSQGYAHVDDAKRTKLEPKSFRCMFLGYAENVKGYRVYDLDASKIMVSYSVQLDERELNGIYDTHVPKQGTVTNVTKDSDVAVVPVQEVQQSVPDEPMEEVEEPMQDIVMDEVEPEREVIVRQLPQSEEQSSTGFELTEYRPPRQVFPEDRLVFHPERERSRQSREPVLLLEDGLDGDEEQKSEGKDGPPSPKRARIDEDTLLAEEVLAYTANIVEGTDTPTTYAQAMVSSDAGK